MIGAGGAVGVDSGCLGGFTGGSSEALLTFPFAFFLDGDGDENLVPLCGWVLVLSLIAIPASFVSSLVGVEAVRGDGEARVLRRRFLGVPGPSSLMSLNESTVRMASPPRTLS